MNLRIHDSTAVLLSPSPSLLGKFIGNILFIILHLVGSAGSTHILRVLGAWCRVATVHIIRVVPGGEGQVVVSRLVTSSPGSEVLLVMAGGRAGSHIWGEPHTSGESSWGCHPQPPELVLAGKS